MNKVTLAQLAESLVEKNGLSQQVAETFAKTIFDVINQGLTDDKLVKVKGLGTFKVTSVKDRESVDVNTGARILIEGRDKINFVPDTTLRDLVNKPFAHFETVVINDGVDFSGIDQKFDISEQSTAEEVEVTPLVDFDTPDEVEESIASDEKTVTESEIEVEETPADMEIVTTPEDEPVVVENIEIVEDSPIEEQEETSQETLDEKDKLVEVVTQETTVTDDTSNNDIEPEIDETEKSVSDESPDTYIETPEKGPNTYKYIAIVAATISFVFGVCLGVLAYQYHKVVMQRNQLSMSLATYQKEKDSGKDSAKEEIESQAKVDSARMVETAKAVKSAEEATQKENSRLVEDKKDSTRTNKESTKLVQAKKETTTVATSQYDSDPRVRTGAYRITGVAETVSVKKGQTLSSISRAHLGPGMECYVEALNGTTTVKEGDKLKIPKLELRKKR